LTGFVVVGEEFVTLWAGTENAQAYWVALILMSSMILYLTQAIGSQMLWALGRHKVQAILNVGVALTNIGLTVVLIKWNPLIGASLGTAIAILIGNVVAMNVVFTRDIGVSMSRYYAGLLRGILPSLVLAALAGWAVRLSGLSGVPGFVAGGLAILLAYGAAMISFGFNSYEKKLLAPVFRRILPQWH
ncbi:MAG: polysaccharide biosynthesis C-terminal domain-containing protein, partial [Actinomycetia bacterium]|nr:polysaccharide biosynthesis C-terminal domain-containing protein [Actinomycetes bacterium]